MGQKVHPVGFRIGVIRDWESKWYLDKGYADALVEDFKIRKYIKEKRELANAGISHIDIERWPDKIQVMLHTGKPGIIIGRAGRGIDDLAASLRMFSKKREIIVNVTEVRHPDIDAQLVAESVGQQISKRIAYKRAMRHAVTRAMKLGAKGIRILCSGRLAGSEMARKETDRLGKIPLQTLRADIDYGFYEAATTYGHIGIKVWIYKGDILPGQKRLTTADIALQQQQQRRLNSEEGFGGDRRDAGRGRGGQGGGGGRGGRGGGGGRGGFGGGGGRGGGGGGFSGGGGRR